MHLFMFLQRFFVYDTFLNLRVSIFFSLFLYTSIFSFFLVLFLPFVVYFVCLSLPLSIYAAIWVEMIHNRGVLLVHL